jgi:restriction endonuclease S subunit
MTKKLQLNEIVDIISGMAFRSNDADPKGSVPVINASRIIAGSTLSDFADLPKIKELPMRSPAVVQDNDLLMVSRSVPGNPFKTSLVKTDSPIVATSSLYIIRVKDKSISPEYLNYFLNSKQFQQEVVEKARGSTIAHISRRILEEIQIPLPDKSYQKAIIGLNQNIQEQNNINKRKQVLKEEIIQATFINLYH